MRKHVSGLFDCWALTIVALCFALTTTAQVRDKSHRVDTLTLAERISMRTNVIDWALMVPNIGIEYNLRSENWSRYAVNLNLRYRPKSSETFVQPFTFNVFEITAEGRVYWHERKATATGYLRRHTRLVDKLFSMRTKHPDHPNWIFYRGLYASYADGTFYWKKWPGVQGQAFMAGVTWGFVKPFVAFQNGNSVDMEFGLSGGVAYAKYDRFRHDYDRNAYVKTSHRDWRLMPFPVVRDLHVALVYRFGNYPLQKRYRWRYDTDMAYRERVDDRYTERYAERERKFVRDSLYRVVSQDFRELYDSVITVRQKEKQEAIERRAPQRQSNNEKKKK